MPLTPFAQAPFGQQQNSRGYDPMTGKPMQGFQMPAPLGNGMPQGGPFLSEQGERSLAMGMMPTNEQAPPEGFEMPAPPQGNNLVYKFGKPMQLDPNATYYNGLGGPKRAQML